MIVKHTLVCIPVEKKSLKDSSKFLLRIVDATFAKLLLQNFLFNHSWIRILSKTTMDYQSNNYILHTVAL